MYSYHSDGKLCRLNFGQLHLDPARCYNIGVKAHVMTATYRLSLNLSQLIQKLDMLVSKLDGALASNLTLSRKCISTVLISEAEHTRFVTQW